jgi:exopolyphosphatase/guanosine-5'-triphosphate,3'-diphosphate pyrophosphatase
VNNDAQLSEGRIVAAADLGSNSFHMVVARWADGRLHVVDKLRERVALAAGLDADRRLTPDAEERALDCLRRFGERLRHMDAANVRAVGTNTLRKMKRSRQFLERARHALGHGIDIIPGREEARLVYLGVAHDVAHAVSDLPLFDDALGARSASDLGDPAGRRLVVDIGGGSTECVVGDGLEILQSDSLFMGCVSYTQRFFPEGKLTRKAMDHARLAALRELAPIRVAFSDSGWVQAIGSSGTILAIERIVTECGWSERHITAKSLRKLRKHIQSAGAVKDLDLVGLSDDRRLVIAGGVAVLCGVFDSLGIDVMETSQSALREGVLHDLLGRTEHRDLRDDTVSHFQQRTSVDVVQAERVEGVALHILERVAEDWDLDAARDGRLLAWAARLHEVGLTLSRSGYHKHGAYLIQHSDMPGFSRDDQAALASIVRAHRRKIETGLFDQLPRERQPRALRLAVLLRVARRLCRSRGAEPPLPTSVSVKGGTIRLAFSDEWVDENPLTCADLEEEARLLAAASIKLVVGQQSSTSSH